MKIGETCRTRTGALFERALPLHKWRRPDGMASFVRDMLGLRKTLSLCTSCEHKMPRKWLSQYNYSLVYGFSTDRTGCDYCRQVGATNLYHAVEGAYAQEMEMSRRFAEATMMRDRRLWAENPRAIVPF